jgi:hypothetical protein
MLKQFPVSLMIVFITLFLLSSCSFPTGQSETPEAPEILGTPEALETPEVPGTAVSIPDTGVEEQNYLPGRMSQLIGAEVRDEQNQAGGEVVEIILNRYGLPEYMVIASGDRYVPVPWTAFSWDDEAGQAVYKMDRNLLDGAPAYTSLDDFPDLYSNNWDQEVIGHWVEQVELPGATDRLPASSFVPRKVSIALDSQAVDFEGEAIGPVEEVLFNQAEQRGYVVIRIGEQFVPIPWDEFDWDPVITHMVYLYENERLQNAPRYGALQELDTTQPDWDHDINQFWQTP